MTTDLNEKITTLEEKLKKANLRADESEKRMYTIIEGSLNAIIVVNQQGQITVFNSQAQDLFQYSENEVLNQDVEILLRKENSEMHKNRLKNYLLRGAGQCGHLGKRTEKIFKRKDGTTFIAEVSMAGSRKGHLPNIVLSIHDITERKKSEEKLILVNEKLKEINITKDKIFSIIGHDLRSPFNGILGFSDLLINNIEKYELNKTKLYLEQINATAKRTLDLLNNLLEWAKSQTDSIVIKKEPTDIDVLINETTSIFNPQALHKNIKIIYKASNKLNISSDKNILFTVLRNLISNALKFTHSGGHIIIEVKNFNSHLELSVTDNGIGIDSTTQLKLFNIETNTSVVGTANEVGSGLGLVLCKEYVNKLGGNIWVESEIGKGSIFKFTIPINSNLN